MGFRSKNRLQNPYTVQDYYKAYIKEIDSKSIYDVDYKTYSLILNLYYKNIARIIIEEGKSFKIPNNLGTLKIIKKKINFGSKMFSTSIDWENTKKYKKIIHHINEHSGGYKYLFMWDKRNTNMLNITKYRFVPTRDLKRKLAFYIKNKIRDYFEL